jgi:pyruvate kinase
MILGSKTKIIATVGPATKDKSILKKMILAGVDVFRLNFSHGRYEDVAESIALIRELEKELQTNIAIMVDLQGPKIRIGKVENEPVNLNDGDIIYFTSDRNVFKDNTYYISYQGFVNDVKLGDIILIDDGKIKLEIIESNTQTSAVKARVINGGFLFSNKGVNLPNTETSIPSLTDKDREDLSFALTQDIDWVALSFVRHSKDIEELREYISHYSKDVSIIAKIEKPEAVKNINSIINVSDAVMVARGDLGVEMNFDRVPIIQKDIVDKCIMSSTPVIIATQMMESMITNFRPTRAEANDVANSVDDGADALMLSGETSVGKYPVETVQAMQNIIDYTEKNRNIYYKKHLPDYNSEFFLSQSICFNACVMAEQTNANAIIPFTHSGFTAAQIASQRPKADIFAFTSNKNILKKLPLLWGVNIYHHPRFETIDEAIEYSINFLLKEGLIKKGDLVVHIASTPLKARDKTNMIKLSKV